MAVEWLGRTDREAAVETLSAAFHDYAVMRWVLGDAEQQYETRLGALVGFFCDKRLIRGLPLLGVRTRGQLMAVAGANVPDAAPPGGAVEEARRSLVEAIGEPAFERLERYETESDLDAPQEPLHFLGIIGVHPAAQGQGLARELIEHLFGMSERHSDSTGVCLNTEAARNVPFYEHLGFEVVAERDVGSLHTWCMFRRNP